MEVSDLVGFTLASVTNDKESICFVTTDRRIFKLAHSQECCEQVYIEDIYGDLQDLINTPIIEASERTLSDPDESNGYTC